VCGGPDKVRLERAGGELTCSCCEGRYQLNEEQGYADLLPRTAVGAVTQYADHDFHERLGVNAAPPYLSARVKADMMLEMLKPAPDEPLLDLGCGAGKLALHTARSGARPAGLDVAPFFLEDTRGRIDLVLGDLRRLPFRKHSFPAAYSLDVLEHLDERGVLEVLVEARRSLARGGRLFVYTHAMESSRLAAFQRGVNRLARRLGERGLIDHEREALRKSDHLNAIRSHEHFDEFCERSGLRVTERRYYNVFFKAIIEDLGLRLYEHTRAKRARDEAAPHGPAGGNRKAVSAEPPGRATLAVASLLTWLLKLDVVLFGAIRTGPFFGLLRPSEAVGRPAA
jgi:ubiquinone/menaquinone biosynthesis C-methylase UbiE